MALDDFIYNAEHGVVVCRRCATCLVPREESWMKHLRAKPHELKGSYLQLTVEHLATYSLRSSDQLRAQAKDTSRQPHPCQPIAGLALYDGFICHCAPGECTTNLCPGTYLESGTRWALALSRILGICSGLSGGAGRKVKILTKQSAALLILEARSEQSKE